MASTSFIAVVGLGYVGLPLAVALARHHRVAGFDSDASRIEELAASRDRTGEVAQEDLAESTLTYSADPSALSGAGIFIITVPTPVDDTKRPDLSAVRTACRTIGEQIAPGAIVVLESTVWPGVTEEICGPEIEAASGLTCGTDFHLGYSPERINPGDRVHTVEKIVKVVSGQTPEVTARLAEIYGSITAGGVFIAKSIKAAEAAKVIENAQRDINIAFVNEVAMIAHKLDIATRDILEAASTKWNFLDFEPGLVGGHCIGVDPYYLAHRAQELGHEPEVILSGRRINDAMGSFVADQVADRLDEPGGARVLVLGLTFKENVPDLRNSRTVDIVETLTARGCRVEVHDPLADPTEAARQYGIELLHDLKDAGPYAALIGAVAHDAYRELTDADIGALLMPDGLVADLRGLWRGVDFPAGIRRWEL
jgi:UDP-N-acetyl-D-glucosamine/UDP-N-acetyl-D-galactosamine dehydrogenase